MKAEIIAVGTELLLGSIVNTDAQFLSRRLAAIGIDVLYHTVVGDNPERLTEALNIAKQRVDIIITTGGLGPTYDDLTKQTIAACFSREMVYHAELEPWLKDLFREQRFILTDNNYQQLYLPEGCTVFHNDNGTAPGCGLCADGVHVLMLPGPPNECRSMWESGAEPYLRALSEEVIVSHMLRIFGLGESAVEMRIRDLIRDMTNPTVAPYARLNECMLRVTAKAKTEAEAETMTRDAIAKIYPAVREYVYGVDVENLEEVCFKLLHEKGLSFAAAESCTGGLVAERFTNIPGASEHFRGGVVSYTNGVKAGVLGVPQDILDTIGAVSAETAKAMAEGVRRVCGSDIGISVTGLAGPGGDEFGNSVGTVYIALADEKGTLVRHLDFGKRSRERIRAHAANSAFDLLRRHLSGLPTEM